ncbi:hypothetical protein [Streptomyces klenkii]|uniref:hypothetical protein n=1 Tax=Streptomyces klenkii TaxID=1420899 RepID=UPI003444312D
MSRRTPLAGLGELSGAGVRAENGGELPQAVAGFLLRQGVVRVPGPGKLFTTGERLSLCPLPFVQPFPVTQDRGERRTALDDLLR